MFTRLFGNKAETESQAREHDPAAKAPPSVPKTAPGTSISYSPQLVGELKSDHRSLLRLYSDIGAAHAAGKLSETSALLDKFRSLLGAHLLRENVRLYIYLERGLASDPGSHELVRQFRHDMDGIGRAVVAFLDRYRNLGTDPSLAGSFAADLSAIGKVLGDRIRNEEDTLYTLYLAEY